VLLNLATTGEQGLDAGLYLGALFLPKGRPPTWSEAQRGCGRHIETPSVQGA
jgi:hypothetical protein